MSELQKRYLGIDWGTVRIGLALGDDTTGVASPFCVVNSFQDLLKKIKEERVDELVLGKPIKMSGQTKNLTKEFEEFAVRLEEEINIPLHFVDERLSSKAADALPGTKKTKASRDAVAAMIILQSYFDR